MTRKGADYIITLNYYFDELAGEEVIFMGIVPNSVFLNYPISTAVLIVGTIILAAIGTITFYLGKWTL